MGKNFLESKAFNIILSILIAVGLWVYVTAIVSEVGMTTVRNVQVAVVGEDVLNAKGLMIAPESKLTVNIPLTGGRNYLGLVASNIQGYFTVSINVAEITEPGTYELPCGITSKNSLLITGVRQANQENRTVTVYISEMMTKNVELRGSFTGTAAEGFRANTPEITPGAISIQGPKSVVSQIEYAQVNIPGEELTKTYSGEMDFVFMTADGTPVEDSDEVKANINTVNVVLPVVKMLTLPLDVEFIYGGGVTAENFDRYVKPYVSIEPESIQISGEDSAITPLEGTTRIVGKIDLSAVDQENQVYTFPITLASELNNDSGINEAKVTVSIKGLETKVVETSNIQIINKPEGFSADAVTQSLQVKVRGPADALAGVDGSQLRVVVDLEGETLRQAQFPFQPKIYLDGDDRCGVVNGSNGYIIVVNIQAQ